jgi:hypothetical protein
MSTVSKKTGLSRQIISFLKNLFQVNPSLTVRPIHYHQHHASAVPPAFPAVSYADYLQRPFVQAAPLPVIEVIGEKPIVASVFGNRRY